MDLTINETNRRREIQQEHNRLNGITPTQINKSIDNQLLNNRPKNEEINDLVQLPEFNSNDPVVDSMGRDELEKSINKLKKQMESEAKKENFMQAAMMRDELFKLKKLLLDKF
jgi:excinuclease ABC subunit B